VRLMGLLLLGLLACGAPALAASLSFQITDGGGRSLSEAVVTLTSESGDSAPAKVAPRDHFIDQQDETFIPAVEVVPVGDQVIFRNSDRTRHHVYSFSPLATFEYVLKPTEQSPPLKMQKAGVVAVGCNIHDFMLNYLFVTDSRWAAKSDDKGVVTLNDVPAGAYIAHFWHPRLRPGAPQPSQRITVGADNAKIAVSLPALPERKDDSERAKY
jgi:plastocyanin